MIMVDEFYNILKQNEIEFFTGIPDSLLKDFCSYIKDNVDSENNIIVANEGNAIGLSTGYYLGTGKIGLVYMQNSGLGNTINPLLSLADPLVYSIPILLLIGLRGEVGVKDEPQHIKQGMVTTDILDAVDIEYEILSNDIEIMKSQVIKSKKYMLENNKPYALIVRKGYFEKYNQVNKIETEFNLTREETLEYILSNLNEDDIVVSTTGKTSREVFEIRERLGHDHSRDFLTVGSMGHSLSIAAGIAIKNKTRNVYCLDGDGSLIMHMGGMAVYGNLDLKNLKHILINNGSHESVGGQETVGFNTDFFNIAKACNYRYVGLCDNLKELETNFTELKTKDTFSFLEIKCKVGSRDDLGRPTRTPKENKYDFMDFIKKK